MKSSFSFPGQGPEVFAAPIADLKVVPAWKLPSLRAVMQSALYWAQDWLLPSDEPKIRYRTNRHGEIVWYLYDPRTQFSAEFQSEDDLRSWLEQRYSGRI